MYVVVDANELFSLLIRGSDKSESILFSDTIELIAPEFMLIEFSKHKHEVLSKTHRSETDFSRLLSVLERRIEFIPMSEFKEFIPEAIKLVPGHIKDAPYIALAMKYGAILWTEERLLKEQSEVKVFNTDGLFNLLMSFSG